MSRTSTNDRFISIPIRFMADIRRLLVYIMTYERCFEGLARPPMFVCPFIFETAAPGHPHPRPPGMGKADRAQARVPLPLVHFALTESSLRHGNVARGLPPPHFNRARESLRIGNSTRSVSHPGNAPNAPRFTPTEKPLRVSNVA
jgi:hypothetical protein